MKKINRILGLLLVLCVLQGKAQPYFSVRSGLNEFYYRTAVVKEATIGFLGGSITYNPGWRDKVCDYLRRRFPETNFRFIAAGIPSLGSLPHAFRVQRDLLDSGRIDLLFLETAVNDRVNGTDSLTQVLALEGIVRHVFKSNPAADIVMMAFADEDKTRDYDSGVTPVEIANQEAVAEHYRLSSINDGKEVKDRIASGALDWKRDFKDVHPAEYGQELYFENIRQLMDSCYRGYAASGKPTTRGKLPSPLDPHCLAKGRYKDVHQARRDSNWRIVEDWQPADEVKTRPGFVHVPVLAASTAGAELKFRFKGTAAGIAVVSGPDAGRIEYSVDGAPFRSVDLYTQWSNWIHLPWYLLLGSGLKDKAHELRLRVSGDRNSGSKGNVCRIVHFLVNG